MTKTSIRILLLTAAAVAVAGGFVVWHRMDAQRQQEEEQRRADMSREMQQRQTETEIVGRWARIKTAAMEAAPDTAVHVLTFDGTGHVVCNDSLQMPYDILGDTLMLDRASRMEFRICHKEGSTYLMIVHNATYEGFYLKQCSD